MLGNNFFGILINAFLFILTLGAVYLISVTKNKTKKDFTSVILVVALTALTYMRYGGYFLGAIATLVFIYSNNKAHRPTIIVFAIFFLAALIVNFIFDHTFFMIKL